MNRLLLFLLLFSPVASGQDMDDLLDDLFEESEPIDNTEGADDDLLDDALLDGGLDDLLGGGELGSATSEGEAADILQGWKGFVELRPRVFLRDREQGRNDEQLLLEAELELDFRHSDHLSSYFRPRFFLDALDGELKRFEPYEAYATYAERGWDLRAGQFVENWGIVDTFNPIDVINRRDFATDALDADRLGELGVRTRHFFDGNETIGEPTVSLYAMPIFRETPFPTRDQRFGFGTNFEDDRGFEPDGLEQALVAARFQSTLQTPFADADVQALVARGPERVPTLFADGGGDLRPAYFGVTTVGAGFRAVPNEEVAGRFLSTLTLKAEVVHKTPYTFDDSPIVAPDDYLAYIFGVDRSFYGLTSDLDQLTMTIEYAHETGASDPSALLRPFRDDLILRGFWEANDFARQSLELRGLFDLDVEESIIEVLYERQLRSIHPDLQFEFEYRYFDVAPQGESFYSLFPNNSSIAVALRWDF